MEKFKYYIMDLYNREKMNKTEKTQRKDLLTLLHHYRNMDREDLKFLLVKHKNDPFISAAITGALSESDDATELHLKRFLGDFMKEHQRVDDLALITERTFKRQTFEDLGCIEDEY